MTRREATLILLAALLLTLTIYLSLAATARACGVERWAVKTLSDRDANQVDHTPLSVTVRFMAAMIPPPFLGPLTSRIFPVETRTYRIKARVVGVKLEEDGDYHLAIRWRRRSMITEAPAYTCTVGASATDRRMMRNARRTILRRFRPSRFWKTIPGVLVSVTGVGFFDLPHHVRGAAKNSIELHPLLAVRAL